MADFAVNGVQFRSAKMDLRKQFHVQRRIALIYPALLGAKAVMESDPLLAVGYVSTAINRLGDEDWDFILNACLEVVQVQQAATLWVNIKTAGADTLQFNNLTLADLDLIVFNVLFENLGPFIDALPSLSSAISSLLKGTSNS